MDECDPCENCYEPEPGKPEVNKCHHSCKTCKGPLETDCLSCSSDSLNNREADVVKAKDTDKSGKCPCKDKFYDVGN